MKGLQELGANSDGKSPIGISRSRWEDNIKTDLKYVFNSLSSSATILRNNKTKFKAAFKYLHTHAFHSVDELSMCKND